MKAERKNTVDNYCSFQFEEIVSWHLIHIAEENHLVNTFKNLKQNPKKDINERRLLHDFLLEEEQKFKIKWNQTKHISNN